MLTDPSKPGHNPEYEPEGSADGVLLRLAMRIPFLGYFVTRRERDLARSQCAILLGTCRTLQAETPGLAGESLYQRVVARHLRLDEPAAREVVRLADVSFAQWPEERDVTFRDVVNYVIVRHILNVHAGALGTRFHVAEVVNASIPEGL